VSFLRSFIVNRIADSMVAAHVVTELAKQSPDIARSMLQDAQSQKTARLAPKPQAPETPSLGL
jgi:hypothetical protein